MLDWIFGSKKEEKKPEEKEKIPSLPAEDMWIYDFIKQYLISPIWRNPLLDFIEENCLVFEDTEENKFQYTKIFQEFVGLCSILLDSIMQETGITEKTLELCIMKGLREKNDRKIFQQILLCDNFLSFKKIMISKNKELQIAAMKAANEQNGQKVDPVKEELDAKELERLQIEKAIAMSLALEEKMKKKEQEQFEEAIRQSQQMEMEKSQSPKKHLTDLPPIVLGSTKQTKSIEDYKKDEIVLEKQIQALRKEEEKKKQGEGAEERKKRLLEQREMIKKKKMEERKQELNAFVQNKPQVKKEDQPKVSEEEIERRKNLMKRLKEQLKD